MLPNLSFQMNTGVSNVARPLTLFTSLVANGSSLHHWRLKLDLVIYLAIVIVKVLSVFVLFHPLMWFLNVLSWLTFPLSEDKRADGDVGEHDDDVDDDGDGNGVGRHEVLVADVFVDQTSPETSLHHARRDLGLETPGSEPATADAAGKTSCDRVINLMSSAPPNLWRSLEVAHWSSKLYQVNFAVVFIFLFLFYYYSVNETF